MDESRAEHDELQSRVLEIQALLAKRAPVLGPRVVPKQLRAACNLVQMCSTVKQRAVAETFLASKAAELAAAATEKDPQGEGMEEEKGSGGDDVVVLETEMDIATRKFRVTAAKVCDLPWSRPQRVECMRLSRSLELILLVRCFEFRLFS